MDITGKIKVIGDTQQVSEKFRKRDIVVTDESSQYPQHILFQLTQDRVVLLDDCQVGDEVKVHFNLRGREWTDPKGEVKYFNSLEAWRVEKVKWDRVVAKSESEKKPASEHPSQVEDDLPF